MLQLNHQTVNSSTKSKQVYKCPVMKMIYLAWPLSKKMDSNVVEKCLAFCQALVNANKTFSLNLSINKDSFVFTNKELHGKEEIS